MAVILANELPLYGCDLDVDEFREIVQELHAVMHPCWTPEELMYRAETEVPTYLRAVRSRCHCQGLPDHVILRTLRNIQKAGEWEQT